MRPDVPHTIPAAARYPIGTDNGKSGRVRARKKRVQLAAERINTPTASKVTRRGLVSDIKDNLPKLAAGLQPFMGFADILHRESGVDDGVEAPGKD
jgi:hypothetical protein